MKNSIHKDINKRRNIYKLENKKLILKSISKNTSLTNSIRLNANLKLFNLSSKHSKIDSVNRCIFTGRKSKISKKYRFSRISFFKVASSGSIFGIRKSSW